MFVCKVLIAQQKEFNRQLKSLMLKIEIERKKNVDEKKQNSAYQYHQELCTYLENLYLPRHFCFVVNMLTIDSETASQLLLFLLLTCFGLNVYTVAMLTLNRALASFVQSILFFICFIQVVTIGFGLKTMIAVHSVLHGPSKMLYKAIGLCKTNNKSTYFNPRFSLKLKLVTYYEVLNTGSPFAFSVGNFAKITQKSLYQVSHLPIF